MKRDKVSGWDKNKKLKKLVKILKEKPQFKTEAIFILIVFAIVGSIIWSNRNLF